MESSSQERNLPATERKLEKAREDGQAPRSRDLAHLAVLGTGALCLLAFGPMIFERLRNEFSLQLLFDAQAVRDPRVMFHRLGAMVAVGMVISTTFGVTVLTVAIGGTVAAGGWVASLKPLIPDLNRLNPLSGFGHLFAKEKFFEVIKMSFIAAMLLSIGYLYLSSSFDTLSALVLQPSSWAIGYLSQWLYRGMGLLMLVIFVVAAADVPLQRFLYASRLKMSQQEVKQESKESDGNPEMKSRIRKRQNEIANGNSVKSVPKADFVLMNPTHYAVAVRYDDLTMHAPRVIAKGADLLAFRIRDIAKEKAIPVLQSPMLARALYANAALDQDIPASLYTAVAQVLAYVYRLKSALRGDCPMPDEPPQPFVPPELDPLSKAVTHSATP